MLLYKYNLSPEDYDRLLEDQNEACAICGVRPDRLCVDHDHETGEVRGLLCSPCNSGLGFFKDRVRLLAAAIVYLEANGKKY